MSSCSCAVRRSFTAPDVAFFSLVFLLLSRVGAKSPFSSCCHPEVPQDWFLPEDFWVRKRCTSGAHPGAAWTSYRTAEKWKEPAERKTEYTGRIGSASVTTKQTGLGQSRRRADARLFVHETEAQRTKVSSLG
ncbi:hypothetical protein NDU88_003235 [Pleurodeles waltl]|uniref:Secreted protein n=1 Tax=Pleurodeles waltl TaxID=8319 RepID=A0AAV7TMX6_PLEWA|nr:hypothetical protein NDU88_003235 [Pleurodeles waltl]